MRKTSKPSTTLNQDLENKLFLITGVKVMVEKNFEKIQELKSAALSVRNTMWSFFNFL